jgi:hypothetical protein
MSANRPAAPISGCGILILFGVSLFIGIVIVAVIGGLIFPPINSAVAGPLVCDGQITTDSERYTTAEGGVGISRTFYCTEETSAALRDITTVTIVVAGLIYSLGVFALLCLFILLNWLLRGRSTIPAAPAA